MQGSKEVWKPIPNHEGLYDISNFARVRSIRRPRMDRKYPVKILKQQTDTKGYFNVHLSKNSNRKRVWVHRLVAMMFIDNPQNLPQVNHINGIKKDNRLENLEWCNASENAIHAYKLGLHTVTDAHRNSCKKNGRCNKNKVGYASSRGKEIILNESALFGSASECARHLNTNVANVYAAIRKGGFGNGYFVRYTNLSDKEK